jgi:hypothetical protein
MKSNRCLFAAFLGLLFAANVAAGQQDLPLFPKYQVLGVIYAPPGSASEVSYNNSTQVGSSHSIMSDSSYTTTQTEQSTAGFNLFGFGYSDTTKTSDQWVSDYQNTSSISLQTTTSNGIGLTGPNSSALGVLHDTDLIVVWVDPVYKTTLMPPTNGGTVFPIQWSGFMFNSCDLNATQYPVNFMQLIDGCDPYNFPNPDIVYIPVSCLKNPYYNSTLDPYSCTQYLPHTSRFWDLDPWGTDSVTKVPLGPGLDVQDYADILQADPFVTQTLVASNTQPGENVYTNPCHPTYGINFDPNTTEPILNPTTAFTTPPFTGTWPPNYCGTGTTMQRFSSFGVSVPYPKPAQNGGSTQATGEIDWQAITSQGTQSQDTHTHSFEEDISLTFAASASYAPAGIKPWSVSNLSAGFNFGTTSGTGYSWTDGQTIGSTATTTQKQSASYSVWGPKASDNWNGPISYNVYQDTVYGTFAFRDPNRSLTTELIASGKTSPIGVAFSGSTNFGTVQVGNHSAAITVTLTNNSPNQMTVQSPALSFSDLAVDPTGATYVSSFQIVSGSDGCSGQVLQANATCTLQIEFAPALNAAPNTIQASYPVAAYVIAAGNETVPVTDPGATTYYESVLVTNTVIAISAGTETATTVSGTAVPAPPTCTGILPSCNVGATLTPPTTAISVEQGQTPAPITLTFKNYYSVPVTINSGAGNGVVLMGATTTDTASYSVPAPKDQCTGQTIQPLATCTVNVQFLAGDPVGTTANTRVSIVGVATGSGNAAATLAFAGISTTVKGLFLTSNQPYYRCVGNVCHPAGTTYALANITNNSSATIKNVTVSVPQYFSLVSSSCSSVASGGSCYVEMSYTQGCTPVSHPDGLKSCSISGSGTAQLTGTFADTGIGASLSYRVSGTYTYENLNH